MTRFPQYRTSRKTEGGREIVGSAEPPTGSRALLNQALALVLLHIVHSPLNCRSVNICCICAVHVAFTINIHLPFIPFQKQGAREREIYLREVPYLYQEKHKLPVGMGKGRKFSNPSSLAFWNKEMVHGLNKTSLNQIAGTTYPNLMKKVAHIKMEDL